MKINRFYGVFLVLILSLSFQARADQNADTGDIASIVDLEQGAASYNGSTPPGPPAPAIGQSWSEYLTSWGSWAADKAKLIASFGPSAVSSLISNITEVVKNVHEAQVTKYLVGIVAATLIATAGHYFGAPGSVVAGLYAKEAARVIVKNAKEQMIKWGQPVKDEVWAKIEPYVAQFWGTKTT